MTDTDEAVAARKRALVDAHWQLWGTVTDQDGNVTAHIVTPDQVRELRAALAAADGGEVERLRAVADAAQEWQDADDAIGMLGPDNPDEVAALHRRRDAVHVLRSRLYDYRVNRLAAARDGEEVERLRAELDDANITIRALLSGATALWVMRDALIDIESLSTDGSFQQRRALAALYGRCSWWKFASHDRHDLSVEVCTRDVGHSGDHSFVPYDTLAALHADKEG